MSLDGNTEASSSWVPLVFVLLPIATPLYTVTHTNIKSLNQRGLVYTDCYVRNAFPPLVPTKGRTVPHRVLCLFASRVMSWFIVKLLCAHVMSPVFALGYYPRHSVCLDSCIDSSYSSGGGGYSDRGGGSYSDRGGGGYSDRRGGGYSDSADRDGYR